MRLRRENKRLGPSEIPSGGTHREEIAVRKNRAVAVEWFPTSRGQLVGKTGAGG